MSIRPDWLTFRRFAAFTTGLTLSLITLGVYTAATGSGLACNAEWPLCSGQLVPALTINPDFIEWFHRFIAMIAGFLIIGTAAWSWRGGGGKNAKKAATLAVLLLPLQISIGAVTVTVSGLIPWGYSVPTHAAHLLVALTIFTLLLLTTLEAYRNHHRRPPGKRAQLALAVTFVGLAMSLPFSRATPMLVYDAAGQSWFVTGSLIAYVGLVATIVWSWNTDRVVSTLASVGVTALFVTMLFGRDIVAYTGTVQLVNLVLIGIIAVSVVAGLWRTTGGITTDSSGGVTVSRSD
ncbi:COX15/CtaA family protein [Natronocalculus amylovorans]|uniref:COX15/CtaA family protein n=1 Tax=Natronocalculus amylovorans TaxID=2917812 RepID=A0AAE3KA82_9EURY|nr:COX15/CtaA family protein [Natronocalculus amylovorans]MCL9816689.1 COX15/CtaA family protein [Natronocalculus amylovorans]